MFKTHTEWSVISSIIQNIPYEFRFLCCCKQIRHIYEELKKIICTNHRWILTNALRLPNSAVKKVYFVPLLSIALHIFPPSLSFLLLSRGSIISCLFPHRNMLQFRLEPSNNEYVHLIKTVSLDTLCKFNQKYP